jgi:predicted metal-dependent TIM-barrel fold hydrolase
MSVSIPFIDAHTHAHGLSYDAWETLGAIGTKALILSAGNPHVHREIHQETPDLEDVRRYWDGPIQLATVSEKKHFIRAYVAVGISSMTRVNQWEQVIDMMPEYLKMPFVVAVGETGIDPIQYFEMHWPLDEQKVMLEEQVRIAKELDKPFLLHTPTLKKGRDFLGKLAYAELPDSGYKQHFLDMDMEIINRVGLDHRRLVIDHVDETIIDYVLRETEAYVGIGVGQSLRHTNPEYFADVVEEFGPERMMINTDHVAYVSCDLLAIPRAIREMLRRGFQETDIRKAVFDNANAFYGLNLTHD